jgi:uncharacterized membrane protein (UPF0127 family)
MQKVDAAKIVSARNWRWLTIAALALVLLVLVVVGTPKSSEKTDRLNINNRQVTLLVASTTTQLETGLGNRTSLPLNEGMLFVFIVPAIQCFWMKDMHFPIDMIWLNAGKEIVYIEANVSPDTYPRTFCPPYQAQYVIELNSGQAQALKLKVGNLLEF